MDRRRLPDRYNAALRQMAPSTYTPTADLDLQLDGAVGEARSTAAVQAQVLQLFDTGAPGLQRYVRSCGLPADAAEDVVQEAFLALFHHLRRGGGTQNLRGWLVQVCYRLALKQRERLSRRHQQEVTLDGPLPDIADPADSPESAIANRQQRRRVRAVMHALPERDRQCLSMRAEGVTYRSIAAALGMSLGAVAKAVARAAVRVTNAVKE
jgi:RNA polymerase sigma-70 factor (ECF subfamily)